MVLRGVFGMVLQEMLTLSKPIKPPWSRVLLPVESERQNTPLAVGMNRRVRVCKRREQAVIHPSWGHT
eukprot:7098309-Pyramimonas_sp.AAC.1